MKFLENIIINEIVHVLIVNYKKHDKTIMNVRPWHGIAFSLGGDVTYTHNSEKIQLLTAPAGQATRTEGPGPGGI